MPVSSPEHEAVLKSLPAGTRRHIEQALGRKDETSAAFALLLDEIARLRSPTTTAAAAKPAAAVNTADFSETYQVSQVLPTRRSVKIGFAKSGVATFDASSGSVLESGNWATYNVLLKLPVPKRPKPQWNIVLAKLGGVGPFIVFTTSEPDPAAVKRAAQYTKYKDLDVPMSRAVAAYVGAREGVLYLLDDFVFFGFKKPLTMVLLAEIESISFTVVTSRTFNIVMQLLDERSFEFEKISHDFYETINAYITEHRLNDESMAEARKAKKQKTEPTELEQAAQELQTVSRSEEEEDALEEDFEDVGSADSDSEDSASESEAGDDNHDDDDDDDDDAAAESNDEGEDS